MQIVIKIAVVSVLALFAIVWVVSISKADKAVKFADTKTINEIFTIEEPFFKYIEAILQPQTVE